MKTFARNYGGIVVAIAVAVVLLAAALAYPGESQGDVASEPVAPRTALSEYSWDELARISAEIGRCANRDDALACARRYSLCAEDGALAGLPTKDVQLANGQVVPVALVDMYRDDLTSGGKAGLTFMFLQPVGEHAMNHAFESSDGDNPDSVGGWAASDMRAWLNGDFLYELPADLRTCLKRVQKLSAGSVGTGDELDEPGRLGGTGSDWTRETSDLLWLPSVAELCGSVPAKPDLGVDSTMAAVYGAEGEQYQLFADWGIAAFQPNAQIAMDGGGELGNKELDGEDAPCTWWLRTKTLEFGDGFWLVGADGTPLNGLGEDARVASDPSFAPDSLWGPDHARGVVPCFCV